MYSSTFMTDSWKEPAGTSQAQDQFSSGYMMAMNAGGPDSSFYGNKGMISSRTRMQVSKDEEKDEKNESVMKSYS